ncbi:MAG: formate dehydrogenase [Desulfobulbaceae bacterium BRH_c16a]|nr:MAG: formate dehydrogenase [Desulfobulbaceae bacterium BRH_c16a]
MTNSIEEFEKADCIFIIGSNTSVAHPLIATRIYRAKKNGAKIIVADPRRIHISEIADIYVRQKMGTDVALLNGIMNVILESGWHDREFIDERTEDYEKFKKNIEAFTPEMASEICGVSAEDIRSIAECYGKAEKASLVYCMGITQHTTGVDNVKTLANLAMLTGNLGKESSGVNPLRGQNNVQGACDMGGLPNVFTAYQPVTSSAVSEKFAKAWGVENISQNVGLTIPAMLEGLENETVKALYVLGENPVVSDPDVHHVKKALQKADFLVVQDIFLTATAELADVVLPGVSFAEKDGTFSNTERRVSRVRQAVQPMGESRQDWQIIQDISTRFGYPMSYASPEDIFKEIASLTPSYAGITYQRLEGDGLQWPCPTLEHAGTRFLHKDKIARGKGLFHAVEFKPPAEIVDDQYPFWLSTGRVFAHYHTGTMTRNSPTLDAEIEEGFLELNVEDAAKIKVNHGDWVTVSSRRGSIEVKAMLTKRIAQGSVFMPFHFIESCANVLTNPAHDPICKIPELKVCAVNVLKAN